MREVSYNSCCFSCSPWSEAIPSLKSSDEYERSGLTETQSWKTCSYSGAMVQIIGPVALLRRLLSQAWRARAFSSKHGTSLQRQIQNKPRSVPYHHRHHLRHSIGSSSAMSGLGKICVVFLNCASAFTPFTPFFDINGRRGHKVKLQRVTHFFEISYGEITMVRRPHAKKQRKTQTNKQTNKQASKQANKQTNKTNYQTN